MIHDYHLNEHKNVSQLPDLGPTELLLGFFEFYSEFKDKIVIAPANNPPFRNLEDLKEELSEKVEEISMIFQIMQ